MNEYRFPAAMGGLRAGGDELGYDEAGRPIYDDPHGGFSGPGGLKARFSHFVFLLDGTLKAE